MLTLTCPHVRGSLLPYAEGPLFYRTPSLCSYASYLVWKELGGGFRWPLALPLGLYSFQLALSWTFLVLFLAADSPGLVRHMAAPCWEENVKP